MFCPYGQKMCNWYATMGDPCSIGDYHEVCPQNKAIYSNDSKAVSEDLMFLKELKKRHPDILDCEIAQMKVWSVVGPRSVDKPKGNLEKTINWFDWKMHH